MIDLFSGCGGLSLGFEMSGFQVILAIEKDEWASTTYKANHPHTEILTKDITKINDLSNLLSKDKIVDGIIGGPPCQGFSLSGNRDPKDPRNSLFMEFIRFVEYYQPSFFVMENVPGILSMKNNKEEYVKDIILQEYNNIGYTTKVFRLNSADYGVPQKRQRVFFIGLNETINADMNKFNIRPLIHEEDYLTIDDAISDLPVIHARQGAEYTPYTLPPNNTYQKWCRENSNGVYNHQSMRHTQRIVERFKNIGWGESVKDVSFEHQQRKRGDPSKLSGKCYSQNNMRPYPHKPSPTITASFQSNFIHPYYDRNFTAREGSRLQSFPDSYIFYGKRTTMSWEKNLSQYQQIGNSVPPLLSKHISENIKNLIKKLK